MRIWIDLANSPHVPFFKVLGQEFESRGHRIKFTAREFAQTVPLAQDANLNPVVIGGYGGGSLAGKAANLTGRVLNLARWALGRKFDLAVSHNSYSQIVAARLLGLRTITLMDYEYQPANHLAFRFASKVIVPRVFPKDALLRYGAHPHKVRYYDGFKEDVYLAGFVPDPGFREKLARSLEISCHETLVLVRPPARGALYHRFENELYSELMNLLAQSNARVLLLPRGASSEISQRRRAPENVLVPTNALDGNNLIAAADLVVSAGGTMNREAAVLGVPAVSIYAGMWAAVDQELMKQGRLRRIKSVEELKAVRIERKTGTNPRGAVGVREEVAQLILE